MTDGAKSPAASSMTRSCTAPATRIGAAGSSIMAPAAPMLLGEASPEDSYIADLKAVAVCYGIYPNEIDDLLAEGITPEEIEEYLYCG